MKEIPNEETVAAMREANNIAARGDYRFTSVEQMFAELEINNKPAD